MDLDRALRRDGVVVPFLDGFDEVAEARRTTLLRALDQALGAGLSVALASREEQLHDAVTAVGAVRGSLAVRLAPLGPEHFASFLTDSRAANRAAWQPLLDAMRGGAAPQVAEVFATPLMQWLGRQVYGGGGAVPTELADPARFPTAGDIERHLLASLVPTVFDPVNGLSERHRRPPTRRTLRWLRFLAESRGDGVVQWWWLHRCAQPQLAVVYGVALTALTAGVSAVSRAAGTGLLAGVLWGTACGSAFAIAYVVTRAAEYRDRSSVPGGFRSTVNGRTVLGRVARLLPLPAVAGVVTQVSFGLLFPPLGWSDLWALLGQGVALAVVAGLSGGVTAGTVLERAHTLDATMAPANATRPLELLRRDSRATAAVAFCLAVATAVVSWTAWSLVLDRTPPVSFLVAAAAMAAVAGPGLFTAWPAFRAAHVWFALRDRLPVRFTDFMAHAQSTGILREEGITYHFRHALLRTALLGAERRRT